MGEQVIAHGSELPDADINAVMRLIPHRYPFLLIDRVVEMRAFESAVGIKSVTINEWFFQGHFPGDPIMPGVLLIEAMAQTAAVLAVAGMATDQQGRPVYFMSIDGARFRRPVRPGDHLRIETRCLRSKMGVWKFAGKAMADGTLAAEAEFNAKISNR
jgi:3-hydroxyacyl-[acyl-carrier-protein] dehydratase